MFRCWQGTVIRILKYAERLIISINIEKWTLLDKKIFSQLFSFTIIKNDKNNNENKKEIEENIYKSTTDILRNKILQFQYMLVRK